VSVTVRTFGKVKTLVTFQNTFTLQSRNAAFKENHDVVIGGLWCEIQVGDGTMSCCVP